jgi:putative membrane protein
MWHGWDMGFGWGGWLIGGLMMLLLWGGAITLVYFAIRALTRSGGEQAEGGGSGIRSSESALGILQKRYARGEISREEFREMKQDLDS